MPPSRISAPRDPGPGSPPTAARAGPRSGRRSGCGCVEAGRVLLVPDLPGADRAGTAGPGAASRTVPPRAVAAHGRAEEAAPGREAVARSCGGVIVHGPLGRARRSPRAARPMRAPCRRSAAARSRAGRPGDDLPSKSDAQSKIARASGVRVDLASTAARPGAVPTLPASMRSKSARSSVGSGRPRRRTTRRAGLRARRRRHREQRPQSAGRSPTSILASQRPARQRRRQVALTVPLSSAARARAALGDRRPRPRPPSRRRRRARPT